MGEKNYVLLFFTQYGATSYAKLLQGEGIQHEMKPAPRSLSSSCGVAIEMTLEEDRDVLDFLTEDVEFIYEVVKDGYRLAYEEE